MTSKILLGLLLTAVVVGLVWLLWGSVAGSGDELTVPVRRGNFVVTVRATGKLESGNAVPIEARSRGNILTYLAPEGTLVAKDEVLARFDDTSLRERLLAQRNDLLLSDAKLAQAQEGMKEKKQELDATITTLEAQEAIKQAQYTRLKSLPHDDDVTRARLERNYRKSCMEIAQQDYEIAVALVGRGVEIFSKEEVQDRELALAQAKGDFEKSEIALKQVMDGALPADLDAAARDLTKAQIDISEAKRTLPEQVKVLEAAVHSAEADVDKMKARLDQTRQDLSELEVKSPCAGMLVYRTMDGKALDLGLQFWHTAHLFDIADLDNMVIRAKVGESEFSRIRVGQTVEARVVSVPDRIFPGTVKEVAKVARDKSEGELMMSGSNKAGIQTFDVLVTVQGNHKCLGPNVEAEVTICCDTIPDALSIPIDSVFDREGKSWVRILDSRRTLLREVTLGVRGSNWVQVTKGLKAGERVLLKPPEKEGS